VIEVMDGTAKHALEAEPLNSLDIMKSPGEVEPTVNLL
jgi:hypothetical protein